MKWYPTTHGTVCDCHKVKAVRLLIILYLSIDCWYENDNLYFSHPFRENGNIVLIPFLFEDGMKKFSLPLKMFTFSFWNFSWASAGELLIVYSVGFRYMSF